MPVTQPDGAIRTLADGAHADAIFSPDSSKLYAVSGNSVTVINVATGATIATYIFGTELGAVDISMDGHYLAIVEEQPSGGTGTLYRLDLTNGSVATYNIPGTAALHDVAFLANGSVVISQEVSAPLRVVNLETGNYFEPSPSMRANATISVSTDGTYIIAQPPGNDWPLHAYDSQTGNGYAVYFDPYAGAGIGTGSNIGAVSPDGSLVVQGAPFRVYQGDFSSSVPLSIGVSNPAALAFSPDGTKLYVLDSSVDEVVVVSTSSWEVLESYPIEANALHFSQWSPGFLVPGELMRVSDDGDFLSIITPTGIQVINLTIVVEPNYEGGPGDDTIVGSDGGDEISGGGGNDVLKGAAASDTLTGDDGNDWLSGGTGTDTLTGGAGNDSFYFGSPLEFFNADHITDLSIGDTIQLETVVFTALAAGPLEAAAFHIGEAATTADHRIIYNSATGQILYDPDGTGSAPIRLIATVNPGTAVSAATFVAVTTGTVTVESGVTHTLAENELNLVLTGDSAINGTGNGLNNQITGNAAANQLMGMDGADTLVGNGGDDYLDGGGGADQLIGGLGDDTYILGYPGFFGEAIDTITELAGEGIDTIVSSFDVYLLPSEVENITLTGFAQSATGNENANILTGNGAINTMSGGGGNDQLFGLASNDSLAGGAGDDLIDGGDGRDAAGYDNATSGVTVSLAISGPQDTGSDGIDTLISIEILGGSGHSDHLTAGALGNSLFGWSGNDFLFGAAGDDELDGGAGNDIYVVAAASDHWTDEFADRGFDEGAIDEVRFAATTASTLTMFAGDFGIERIVIGTGLGATAVTTGLLAHNVDASALNYGVVIIGNDGANHLTGGLGGDELNGNAGNDWLYGGDGNDSLAGGVGDDMLEGAGGFDTANYVSAGSGVAVSLAIAGAQNTGGAGSDTLSNIENLTGSAFADSLTGNAANNSLVGGDGDDVLTGSDGNDTLDGGAGNDTASYASAASQVSVSLALPGPQNTLGDGVDTLTNIENLTGSAFNDTLMGDANANVLIGNGGSDVISGGDGADEINGGAGNDTLSGGAGNDGIDGGEGFDTASYASASSGVTVDLGQSGAQNTIGAGSDSLLGIEGVIGSAFNDTLTGNVLGNVIEGGAGNDAIDGGAGLDTASYASAGSGVTVNLGLAGAQNTGGAGSDTLTNIENLTGSVFNDTLIGSAAANVLRGGTGNDRYVVDQVGDVIVEGASEGAEDWVFAGASYGLNAGAHVEVLGTNWADGTAAINLTGNELAQSIYGNAGANILNGGGGADRLIGGFGNDIYVVDDANVTIAELADESGEDWVFSSVSYGLNAGAEVEVLGTSWADGTAAINLTGNELAQSIYGNAGANILNGGGGADRLIGGFGNDIYLVDDANVQIAELADESGEDWVFSSVSFGLNAGAHVEVLGTNWADGTAAINLTGNELAQKIYGNAGANILNGGGGSDNLVGGAGADRFAFTGAPGNDVIGDFLSGTDKIDLSAFGITAAQVSSSTASGNTLLSIDSNADGSADFTITLVGAGAPAAGDYIF